MRKYFLFVLLFPLLSPAQDAQLEKFVDSLVGPMNKPDVPGTMILVARDGQAILEKAYGMAYLEMGVPLRTDHAFGIGSISKQFTAVAMLQLVQQGKVKLTDDIRKYFPHINTYGYTITIDNLLSHTSGISSSERKGYSDFGRENGIGAHPDRFVPFIMSEALLFPPGTNWSYNNVAYKINSIIIEKVSGKSFRDYMNENIFQPAGMTHTFIADDLHPINNLANSYLKSYDGKWQNENIRRVWWDWFKGAGNIVSTLDDMLKWDIALRENKVLSAEWKEKAWTPYILKNGMQVNYGYGWDISKPDGLRIISHGGSAYAYNATSVHIPEKKLYIFYISFSFANANVIPKRIISRLLDIPFPKPAALIANTNLSDYVGTYEIPHASVRLSKQMSDRPICASFTTSGDTLYAQYTERERTFLRPAGKDVFLPQGAPDFFYVFNRDAKENVESMQVKYFLFGGPMSAEKNIKRQLVKKETLHMVAVSTDVLKKYTGTYYRTAVDSSYFIELQGSKLYARDLNPATKFELLPIGENKFVRKGVEDLGFSFSKDKDGLTLLTVSGNRTSDFRKLAD